ncbi:MAG: tRNA pseudouridine(55) synthase TruB [Candidatus Riflebacteria bacterium]|nr:tRNA pseudouridine(55) synthase TruB [Candidatus Riflebacteria bacterium]
MKVTQGEVSGLLVVDKPKGWTSHDVIAKIRRKFKVKCGHSGTLDPMATGVLLVFTEKALKLLSLIEPEEMDKTYSFVVTLGATTDTYDAEGTVVSRFEGEIDFTPEELEKAVKAFTGTIKQTPPDFSAVKIKGQPAYKLARKGKEVTIPPREVHVESLECLEDFVENGERKLRMRVSCSRGTYIRSLAHDLAANLGFGGHLSFLRRERVGRWSEDMAISMEILENTENFALTPSFIQDKELTGFPKLIVTEDGERNVSNGRKIFLSDILSVKPGEKDSPYTDVLSKDGDLIAVYEITSESSSDGTLSCFKPVKVFNAGN